MELNPHDLIEITDGSDIFCDTLIPDWVFQSLEKAPYVVVRRAPFVGDMVPVGIRGQTRNKRFGAFLPCEKIKKYFTPEQIVLERLWEHYERTICIDALSTLPFIEELLTSYKVSWGPTGSVGFELVSRVPTASSDSDIDIVIKSEQILSLSTAKQMVNELKGIPVRVDIQHEIPKGSISLLEYSQGKNPILLRTKDGPQLINIHT